VTLLRRAIPQPASPNSGMAGKPRRGRWGEASSGGGVGGGTGGAVAASGVIVAALTDASVVADGFTRGAVGGRQVERHDLLEERGRILCREAQIGLPYLRHLAASAQAAQRQRRIGLSIFARHGPIDFRPKWSTRRDDARETPAEKQVDGARFVKVGQRIRYAPPLLRDEAHEL
jgi:hypothetical protein